MLPLTPSALKRYYVQARRAGEYDGWVTDLSTENYEKAVHVAHDLHETYGRIVRVVDDDERLYFKLGSLPTRPRRTPR